jgi:glycosyltransferase involved in cell wall biosynthesis
MKEEFRAITEKPILVIPNGYDPDDIQRQGITQSTSKFSICHAGMINEDRNHVILYQALSDLCKEHPLFKSSLIIKFVGKLDQSVIKSLKDHDLMNNFEYLPYIEHSGVSKFQQESSILYLPINNTPNAKGILTGKIFEYLGAERPILCIGPTDGDAANIINECDAGKTSDFNDLEGLKKNLFNYFTAFQSETLILQKDHYKRYSREDQAKELDILIMSLCR